MVIVPLQAVPNQTVYVTLNGQATQIDLETTDYGLFMDLISNGVLLLASVICQNLNLIVRTLSIGYTGDFMFLDNQGDNDPVYTGLGSRYQLVYLTPQDLPPGYGQG